MTLEEYKSKVKSLKKRHGDELRDIAIEYANENRIADIGDIVTDHCGSLKVERITYSGQTVSGEGPTCIYHGLCFTESCKPFKNNKKTVAWQDNIKSVNGVAVK